MIRDFRRREVRARSQAADARDRYNSRIDALDSSATRVGERLTDALSAVVQLAASVGL